jgi:thymidine kinase
MEGRAMTCSYMPRDPNDHMIPPEPLPISESSPLAAFFLEGMERDKLPPGDEPTAAATWGTIWLWTGAMRVGKTFSLFRQAEQAELADEQVRKTLIVCKKGHNRHGETHTGTHNGHSKSCIKVERLGDIPTPLIRAACAIAIDEGQFFDDLVEECLYFAHCMGKDVFVAALNATYDAVPFENVARLEVWAKTTKMAGVCMNCKQLESAILSRRLTDEIALVVMEDAKYASLCPKCYVTADQEALIAKMQVFSATHGVPPAEK